MQRRSFLAGIAAGAATLLGLVGSSYASIRDFDAVPTLYADGFRDDTPALQALVDGRSYRRAPDLGRRAFADERIVMQAVLRVDGRLRVPTSSPARILACYIHVGPDGMIQYDDWGGLQDNVFENAYERIAT